MAGERTKIWTSAPNIGLELEINATIILRKTFMIVPEDGCMERFAKRCDSQKYFCGGFGGWRSGQLQ